LGENMNTIHKKKLC